ncbi:MAG: hypothetical protein IOB85_15975 [Methylobacterium sp.]|nr:hypothetical protein [Roseomonas sp.]MCA3647911.1 hypothetical protein [Methylobacterium sp.]MCA3667366.1 hypothetical protein [Methylobacterium sp.]MCA3668473.1 hypothetical protein [Methylobacterium sp.]MCA3671886.1 hypothetical protein [Methylobacterium sp.]
MIIESEGVHVLMVGDVVRLPHGAVATVREVREVSRIIRERRGGEYAYRTIKFPFKVRVGWFDDCDFREATVWLESLQLVGRG